MSSGNTVYVILENWRHDTGEKVINVSLFSNYELAKAKYEELKRNYKIDYEEYHTHDLKFNETINDKGEYIELEAHDTDNYNYFNITVFREKVKENLKNE